MADIFKSFEEEQNCSQSIERDGTLFTVLDGRGDTIVAWRAPHFWRNALEEMSDLRLDIVKRGLLDVLMIGHAIMNDVALMSETSVEIDVPASAEVNTNIILRTVGDGTLPSPLEFDTTITLWSPE
jgi:hypothetical protein